MKINDPRFRVGLLTEAAECLFNNGPDSPHSSADCAGTAPAGRDKL